MEEKNELNDIILNKNSKNNSTKKILLTVATFAIILIIVVIIMNQVGGKEASNLPHAPETMVVVEEVVQEPELEEETIPVIENSIEHTSELVEEEEVVVVAVETVPDGKDETERIVESVFEEPDYTATKQKSTPKSASTKPPKSKQIVKPSRPSGKYDPKNKRVVQKETSAPAGSGEYYIQVGSFATYAPSKRFLDKIADNGYTYTFHKITRSGKTLNKVLVGPFKTQSAAREALPVIKRSVEPGAFLTKI